MGIDIARNHIGVFEEFRELSRFHGHARWNVYILNYNKAYKSLVFYFFHLTPDFLDRNFCIFFLNLINIFGIKNNLVHRRKFYF